MDRTGVSNSEMRIFRQGQGLFRRIAELDSIYAARQGRGHGRTANVKCVALTPMPFIEEMPASIRRSIRKAPPAACDPAEDTALSFRFPVYKDYKEDLIVEGEKAYLQELMSFTQGSVKEACEISGLGRTWLYTLLKKYGISRLGWPSSDTPS